MGVRFGCTRKWVYVALAIPSLIHADNQKKFDYRRLSRRRLAEAGELQRTRGGRQTSHLHNKSYSGQALRLKLHKVHFFTLLFFFYA